MEKILYTKHKLFCITIILLLISCFVTDSECVAKSNAFDYLYIEKGDDSGQEFDTVFLDEVYENIIAKNTEFDVIYNGDWSNLPKGRDIINYVNEKYKNEKKNDTSLSLKERIGNTKLTEDLLFRCSLNRYYPEFQYITPDKPNPYSEKTLVYTFIIHYPCEKISSDDIESDPEKKEFFEEVLRNMMERNKKFKVVYNGNPDSIPTDENIYDYVEMKDDKASSDDGEYLLSVKNFIYNTSHNGTEHNSKDTSLTYEFDIEYSENKTQLNKLNKKIKSVLKKLKVSKMSDVAKVKAVHDYIVKHVSYDHYGYEHNKGHYSAYDALCTSKHKVVCEGYSWLAYKMLTEAGIETHVIKGTANNGDGSGYKGHAWNIVKINNKWYNLDVTWDDASDSLGYNYFLIGTKQINKNHKTDAKYKIQKNNYNWKKMLKNSKNKADKSVSKNIKDF